MVNFHAISVNASVKFVFAGLSAWVGRAAVAEHIDRKSCFICELVVSISVMTSFQLRHDLRHRQPKCPSRHAVGLLAASALSSPLTAS